MGPFENWKVHKYGFFVWLIAAFNEVKEPDQQRQIRHRWHRPLRRPILRIQLLAYTWVFARNGSKPELILHAVNECFIILCFATVQQLDGVGTGAIAQRIGSICDRAVDNFRHDNRL